MKLVLYNDSSAIKYHPDFALEEAEVGYVNGHFSLEKEEVEALKRAARQAWERAKERFNWSKFVGHLRFDLIPRVENPTPVGKKGKDGRIYYDLGKLSISGIYEINAQDPECAAADNAMRKVKGNTTPPAVERLANTMKEVLPNQRIAFVRGNGPVKTSWGEDFTSQLLEAGLDLEPMTPEEAQKRNPPILWRWAILQWGEYDDLPKSFAKWLLEAQKNHTLTVNHLFPPHEVGADDKRLVMTKEDFILTTERMGPLLRDQENYVLKPLRGGSGRGIYFGEKTSPEEWRNIVSRCALKGNYGAFYAQWLPRITLRKEEVTFDVNPSFFFDGKELRYLYTIIRMDKWSNYEERRAINVAQGGGFAGTAAEEQLIKGP